MKISKLHHLTQDLEHLSHLEQIKLAHNGGSDWVQLRVKNKTKKEILEIAYAARKLTLELKMSLIINDHVDIAFAVDADGVHVGLDDLPVKEARKILGSNKIIGGTTNSLENIEYQIKQGADYLGVGPYRFTETKQNLKPLLGPEGIITVSDFLKNNYPDMPVVVIGGIKITDVKNIINHGFYGVAVSSAINLAENPTQATQNFLNEF